MDAISKEVTAALPDAPALAAAFDRLARGDKFDLAEDLVCLEGPTNLTGTSARTHCYALGLNGMGWPRVELLVENVVGMVLDYAMPRSRIQAAVRECGEKGHQAALIRLGAEAKSLFTHLGKSGEGGELLLFCLAETVLGFPQLLAKMHLKTSSELHYNGADGVHASINPTTGQLCVWWGESKLHKTPAGAIRECIDSLAPFLIEPMCSTAKRARDLQLLRYGVDVDDAQIEAAIKAYLDTKNPLYKKLSFGGIGLVGFNHDCYPPHPAKADADAIAEAISASSEAWKKGLGKRMSKHSLDAIDLHLFFLPFPSVDVFRKRMLKAVGAT